MKDVETAVAEHYGNAGLLDRIIAALQAGGIDLQQLTPDDLAPVDEFHTGGRKATRHAVAKLLPKSDQHVLDVGCGIGGAARFMAAETGCRVTGIDLTPDYIATAKALTQHTGQSDEVQFETASALAMPFADAAFDGVLTIHMAMNIHKRAALYAEIARVMKPGARLCIYDMMKKNDEPIAFPVPWADGPETSHLTTPDDMRALLSAAGFEVVEVEDRSDIARDFFRQRLNAPSAAPPALGIHIVLGQSARQKFENTLANIEAGRLGPVQIIARRKA